MITAILKHKDFLAELSKRVTVREIEPVAPLESANAKAWRAFVSTLIIIAVVLTAAQFSRVLKSANLEFRAPAHPATSSDGMKVELSEKNHVQAAE